MTLARGSGSNSTTLVVDDAMYFQDGTWGSDLARGATFFPDWIAVGSTANVVQISGIDYSKNTLMLAAPISGATRLPSGSSRSLMAKSSSPALGRTLARASSVGEHRCRPRTRESSAEAEAWRQAERAHPPRERRGVRSSEDLASGVGRRLNLGTV